MNVTHKENSRNVSRYRWDNAKTPMRTGALGNRSNCNILLPSAASSTESGAVIQKVPELSALAISRARDLARKFGYVTAGGAIDYMEAMRHFRELGFERNIFPSAMWHRRDPGAYFLNCIERYYGTGVHRNTRLMGKGLHGDETLYTAAGSSDGLLLQSNFDYGPNGAVLKNALSLALTNGLFSAGVYFLNDPNAPESTEFCVGDMTPVGGTGAAHNNPPNASAVMPKLTGAPIRPDRYHSVSKAMEKANRLMNNPSVRLPELSLAAIPMAGPPAPGVIRGGSYASNTIHFIDSVYTGGGAPNPLRSANRTFVHEAAHHFEANLGVEDLMRLYRAMYARSSNANLAGSPGMDTFSGNMNRLSVPGIDNTDPQVAADTAALAASITAQGKKTGGALNSLTNSTDGMPYYSRVYPQDVHSGVGWTAGLGGAPSPMTPSSRRHGYKMGTEYLSTSAEMLSHEDTAGILINHDPVKCAIFLKLANPAKYGDVKTAFESDPNVSAVNPNPDLDRMLHMD